MSALSRYAAATTLPYDRLPGFVWPLVGVLGLACMTAWAYRFVVHQLVMAERERRALATRNDVAPARCSDVNEQFGADADDCRVRVDEEPTARR